MTKTQHIHKYKRLTYKSGNAIFFCALPECNQKINIALALGKRSLCWRCGEPFIMSEYSLRLAKPHCDACHKSKKIDITVDEIINPDGSVAYGPERYQEVPKELSLSDRLSQTIQNAQQQEEEEI